VKIFQDEGPTRKKIVHLHTHSPRFTVHIRQRIKQNTIRPWTKQSGILKTWRPDQCTDLPRSPYHPAKLFIIHLPSSSIIMIRTICCHRSDIFVQVHVTRGSPWWLDIIRTVTTESLWLTVSWWIPVALASLKCKKTLLAQLTSRIHRDMREKEWLGQRRPIAAEFLPIREKKTSFRQRESVAAVVDN
jgi:hypothetical protein